MIDNVTYDIVRPVGKGANEKLIPLKLVEARQSKFKKFSKCSLDMFRKMKNGHNCFSSKICITAVDEMEQSELISNCLPVCNPSICVPDTGECGPTHKPYRH